MSEFARFWSLVDIRSVRECWEWKGSRDKFGYGFPDSQFQIGFGEALAHRIACAMTRARDSDALFVLHSCDNPPCCNPRHLRWGSPAANSEDQTLATWAASASDAKANGCDVIDSIGLLHPNEKTPASHRLGIRRLDEPTIVAIRADFATGMRIRDIGKKYGLTQSHADSVAKRRIWKQVA